MWVGEGGRGGGGGGGGICIYILSSRILNVCVYCSKALKMHIKEDKVPTCIHVYYFTVLNIRSVPYNRKLSKTLANFTVLSPSTNFFSMTFVWNAHSRAQPTFPAGNLRMFSRQNVLYFCQFTKVFTHESLQLQGIIMIGLYALTSFTMLVAMGYTLLRK